MTDAHAPAGVTGGIVPRPRKRLKRDTAPGDVATASTTSRTLVVVRTTILDRTALTTYAEFSAACPGDVLLCAAEALPAPSLAGRDLPRFVTVRPDALGLYAHPAFARRCADYFLYRARQDLPDYDYYWLVQSDVFINVASLQDYLSGFAGSDADLLAINLAARADDWGWIAAMRPLGQPVYGCDFSLLRVSGRAVDHLRNMRVQQAQIPALAQDKAWPKDEAFTPTLLASGGFVCRDFNDGATRYTAHSLTAGALTDRQTVSAGPKDGLIHHPVRSPGEWLEQIEAVTGAVRRHSRPGGRLPGLRTRADATWLGNAGRGALAFAAENEAAFVPLIMAEELWRSAPWEETDPTLSVKRADMMALAFRRRFGAARPAASLATAHHAVCSLPKDDLAIARPSDFVLGPGTPVGRFPISVALPYAYDIPAREMLATLHVTMSGLLQQPFLYAAQRDRTRIVARIPFASLPKLYGPVDRAADPVLIFSLGRTGSTLLQKLIACVTARSISEPDLLTQLAQDRAALLAMAAGDRAALIYYAVAPFGRVRLAEDAGGPCVIKLRSQVNVIAGEIADSLPAAKYVFMVRERRAWAKSTYRAYGNKAEAVVNRVVGWLHDLERLKRHDVDLQVVAYEDVVADPRTAVRLLTGADPAADPGLARRIASVASVDSQASHRLSRDKSPGLRDGEAAWLARFDEVWAERRPGALLARLGLDF